VPRRCRSDLNEGNRDGEIKKSVMMGFSRNYDGLFYKMFGRKKPNHGTLAYFIIR
jgi:hypothetical protein